MNRLLAKEEESIYSHSNAIKFSPDDGKITIHLETIQHPDESNKQLIRITDQGIGLPETELESIFNQFIQSSKTKTGAGGTGLGLSICKKIIEKHNGKIWAENHKLSGAVFKILLPEESITRFA